MAPSTKNLQLTSSRFTDDHSDTENFEDVRLLDYYHDSVELEDGNNHDSRRIQVSIGGMTCSACSNSVESILSSINGVFKASVALLQNKADVVFDPALIKVCFLFV